MTVVREFHAAFGHPAPLSPPLRPDAALLRLRLRLVAEEYQEVREEFQKLFSQIAAGNSPSQFLETYRALLKELSDLRYVVDGAAIALGLPIEEGFAEVHRSNMSKLGPDGRPVLREDGKVLKGPNYTEADMHKLLPDIIEHD